MRIIAYQRSQLLQSALEYTGLHPVHQTGPAKGKPVGKRHLSRAISCFVKDLKSQGKLIEQRPLCHDGKVRRRAQFVFVPQTLDMFAQMRQCDNSLESAN